VFLVPPDCNCGDQNVILPTSSAIITTESTNYWSQIFFKKDCPQILIFNRQKYRICNQDIDFK
jgi:hypothetical protein